MGGIKIDMKFAINIISLLGAIAWGWYQMELRVATLEMKIEHNEKMALLRDEIMEIKSKENGLRTD